MELPWRGFAEWMDPRLPDVRSPDSILRLPHCEYTHGFHSVLDVQGRIRLIFPGRWGRDPFVCAQVAMTFHEFQLGGANKEATRTYLDSLPGRDVVRLLCNTAALVRIKPTSLKRIRRDPEYGKRRRQEIGQMCAQMVNRRKEIGQTIRQLLRNKPAGFLRSRKRRRLVALRWARWLMRRPADVERAFWAQLQSRLRSFVKTLAPVSDALRENRALEVAHYEILTRVMAFGKLAIRPYWESSRFGVRLVMEPRLKQTDNAVEQRVLTVLAHVAYTLAREAADVHNWPVYSVKCRNPLCRKKFYTARKSAVACPRTSPGRRSECKAAWEAFRAWLKKAQLDPDIAWKDPVLRKQFKAEYKPRGPQSGMR